MKKNIRIESTQLTIFKEGVFRKPKVLVDIYHHFRGDLDQARIQVTLRENGLIHKEMDTCHMLKVYSYILVFNFINLYNSNPFFYCRLCP